MDFDHTFQPELAPRISPKLIASTKLLSLSSQELAERLQKEAGENPALEVEEVPQCPVCGGQIVHDRCPTCAAQQRDSESAGDSADWASPDIVVPLSPPKALAVESEYDLMTRVQSEETLADHLLDGLAAAVDASEMGIAEYLVGSLDDRGFLPVSVEQVAMALEVPIERVERVLCALHGLEPPGIGARDVKECMLLQLEALAEQGIADAYAERIVTHHLRDAASRRWREIANALGTTEDDVHDSFAFIKEYLNPFPANGFVPSGGQATRGFQPDVIIRKAQQGFEVEVVEATRFNLRINNTYQELARRYSQTAHAMSAEEHEHVKTHVARARFFIDCVRQRWETLHRITTHVIEVQQEFLVSGVSHLKPLTRSELADMVGLHPSTVSRATADKFVMLPSGRTIPFHDFFDASLSIKDTIKEIIREEGCEGAAMSDQRIAEQLAHRHLHIARRTVAKYRDALRILPSRSR